MQTDPHAIFSLFCSLQRTLIIPMINVSHHIGKNVYHHDTYLILHIRRIIIYLLWYFLLWVPSWSHLCQRRWSTPLSWRSTWRSESPTWNPNLSRHCVYKGEVGNLREVASTLRPPCSAGRWPSTWPCSTSRCPASTCCAVKGTSPRKLCMRWEQSWALLACVGPEEVEFLILPKNCDKRTNKRSTVCRSATLFPKAFLSLTQSLVSSNIASALASSSLAQPICNQYFLVKKCIFLPSLGTIGPSGNRNHGFLFPKEQILELEDPQRKAQQCPIEKIVSNV